MSKLQMDVAYSQNRNYEFQNWDSGNCCLDRKESKEEGNMKIQQAEA